MAYEPFNPDWTVAPSATLTDWLSENATTPGQLARIAGRGTADVKAALIIRDVLTQQPLHAGHAEILEHGTGIPARMWLALEQQYRGDLTAGRTDTTHNQPWPAGDTELDHVVTWGACQPCQVVYQVRTVWQAALGASTLERYCPSCGTTPDTQPA